MLPGRPDDPLAFEPKCCARCQGWADPAGFFYQGYDGDSARFADELLQRWRTEPSAVRDVPDVTLVCVDCVNPQLAAMALDVSRRGLQFSEALLLSHGKPPIMPPGIGWHPIPLLDKDDYNRFCLADLWRYVHTSHCLTIQTDGFVLRPELWDNAWLAYDYIGAPWPAHKRHAIKSRVGNSGCCLRSKRLLSSTPQWAAIFDSFRWDGALYDDVATCLGMRSALVAVGMQFAPPAVAARFAVEEVTEFATGLQHCFGFHNRRHFPVNLLAGELEAWEQRTCRTI
jgi:hypothetical protein